MSNDQVNTNTQLSTNTGFTSLAQAMSGHGNLAITPQHVIDIKISKLLEDLTAAKEILEKRVRETSKSITSIGKKIADAANSEVKARMPASELVTDALLKFGYFSANRSYHVKKVDFDNGVIRYGMNILVKINKGDYGRETGELQDEIKIPQSLIALNSELNATQEKLNALHEQLNLVVRQIQRVPDIERRLRAEIARFVLGKADGGNELLKQVEGVEIPAIDDLIKSIRSVD